MTGAASRPGSRRVLAMLRAVEGAQNSPPDIKPGIAISLTRGLVALVDEEDLPIIEGRSWFAKPRSGRGSDGYYAASTVNGRHLLMHRLIMAAPVGLVVDHINGDGLDNRRGNFRLCTQKENTVNTRRKSRSGFRGVTRTGTAWVARISGTEGTEHLGTFGCPIAAARAYDEAALARYGPFAVLNFRDQKENG